MTTLTFDDLNSRYEQFTSALRCQCAFSTEMVGGQPGGEEGIRQFVIHHLKIADPVEQEKAVQRIMHEEVEAITPPEGEIPETKIYGLRVVRKNNLGPWVGDWMIKAAIKQASSGLDIFRQLLGSKRSFAECGRAQAWQESIQDAEQLNRIYLRNGNGAAHTYYKQFMGRVSSPKGAVSIIHQSECVAPGSRFAFEFRFMPMKGITEDLLADMLSLMMIVGLGSARSLQCGRFRIEHAEIEMAKTYHAKRLDVA